MEPIQTDYRLERWLAILLSLLFFLPFVARADDIVFGPEIYHGDEMPYHDGEEFLGLDESGVLIPVKITVTPIRDFYDAEGETSGKEVSVLSHTGMYLLRGKNLHPGKVTSAEPDFAQLIPDVWCHYGLLKCGGPSPGASRHPLPALAGRGAT